MVSETNSPAYNTPWFRRVTRWARRHHRKAAAYSLGAVAATCALSVITQLCYPSDRTLPGTKLAGEFLVFRNKAEVQQVLKQLGERPLALKLADKTYQVSLAQAGVSFATDRNVEMVLGYPLDQRFIPFSMFFQHKQTAQKHLQQDVDEAKLRAFADKLAAESNAQPIEGVVSVQNGEVTAQQPKPGVAFTAQGIMDALQKLPGNVPKQVVISGQAVAPTYDAAAVQNAAAEATSLIKPFTLTINTSSRTVPAATVGSWLSFTPDATTRQIEVGFNTAAIKTYLDAIAPGFYVAPTKSIATLLDNHEVSRQSGKSGTYLDTTAGATAIAGALHDKTATVSLALKPAASPVSYIYTYSATSAGLQALLNNWVGAHGGVKWGIRIAEVGGKNRSAGYNAGTGFMTASIYKLYVSYTAQKQISAGTLDPNTTTSTGQSIATCLDIMIINSDNPCAKAVADMVGWATVTADAHAAGFTSTNLTGTTLVSTPADTALFLQKLANGSLMDSTQSAALVSRMEHQIYRQGLPAGSSGATVADKVGFYGSYLHDAGIVYATGGTYVVSVFSDGGSWSQIANLASTVSSYMKSH